MEKLDIFISSPSDVRHERRLAEKVVGRLSDLPYTRQNFVLNPLAYEEEVPAEIGESPQFTVDNYMRADQCAVVVCILWQRMGTPISDPMTREYFHSGTEYEFVQAYRARLKTGRPRILLYRMMKKVQPDTDVDQLS